MRKVLLFILFIPLLGGKVYAWDGFGVLSGYFSGSLKHQDDYTGMPILLSGIFDAKPVFAPWGIKSAGRLDLIVEPFVNPVFGPHANIEAGANCLFEYAFPLSLRVMPFIKGGIGALYMSQHVREQSTQWNFLPQAGMGFHFFVDKHIALTLECRFRHLSNCGVKKPNTGVNVRQFLGGVSCFFN